MEKTLIKECNWGGKKRLIIEQAFRDRTRGHGILRVGEWEHGRGGERPGLSGIVMTATPFGFWILDFGPVSFNLKPTFASSFPLRQSY